MIPSVPDSNVAGILDGVDIVCAERPDRRVARCATLANSSDSQPPSTPTLCPAGCSPTEPGHSTFPNRETPISERLDCPRVAFVSATRTRSTRTVGISSRFAPSSSVHRRDSTVLRPHPQSQSRSISSGRGCTPVRGAFGPFTRPDVLGSRRTPFGADRTTTGGRFGPRVRSPVTRRELRSARRGESPSVPARASHALERSRGRERC